ncbi:MAG: ornithine carbamoyltransferase [Bacillota bacterium]
MPNLKGADLLSLRDLTLEELYLLLETAGDLKRKWKRGERQRILEDKTLAMVFQIPSTRTSISFETAMTQLGGHAIYLGGDRIWSGKAKEESWGDTVGTIDRYADALVARVMAQADLKLAADIARIPVINGSTDEEHPCQALADTMTALEKVRDLRGKKYVLTWAWRHSNPPIGLVNSSLYAMAKLGVQFVVACPEGYEPEADVLGKARADARPYGTEIEIVHDMKKAVKDADFVNIYCWVSPAVFREGLHTNFAAPAPHNAEPDKYRPYWYVTDDIIDLAKPNAYVMHCMPAARGEEVADSVLDGPRSIILDEAENRLHIQKAILALLMA